MTPGAASPLTSQALWAQGWGWPLVLLLASRGEAAQGERERGSPGGHSVPVRKPGEGGDSMQAKLPTGEGSERAAGGCRATGLGAGLSKPHKLCPGPVRPTAHEGSAEAGLPLDLGVPACGAAGRCLAAAAPSSRAGGVPSWRRSPE